MDYVKLGNTGLDVSPICLGCMSFGTAEGWVHNPWALDEEGSRAIIKNARKPERLRPFPKSHHE